MVLAVIVAFAAASVLVALLCIGSALCWFGVHGLPRDRHQHCAHCGYDLHGWPTTPARCSDCGRRLNHWRDVATAHRRIEMRPIGYGIALIVSGVSPIVATMLG